MSYIALLECESTDSGWVDCDTGSRVVVIVEWVVVSSWSSLSSFEAGRAPGSFKECIIVLYKC